MADLSAPARRGPRRGAACGGSSAAASSSARRPAAARHRDRRAANVGAPSGRPRLPSTCGWASASSPPPTRRYPLQWPEVPIAEELEPVTGRALRDFILEQSKIRGIGKVLSLRSRPVQLRRGGPDELHALMRIGAVFAGGLPPSPGEVKLIVVTRHPELWSWLVGCRTTSTTRCSMPAAAPAGVQLCPPSWRPSTPNCIAGPGTVDGAGRSTPSTTPSPMEAAAGNRAGPALGDRRRQRRHP